MSKKIRLKPHVSSGQRLLRNILTRAGYLVWLEYRYAGYSIDCYLPEFHIGIEYDGPIHTLKVELDKVKQAELSKQGLPVMRVTNSELKEATKTNAKELLAQLVYFINHANGYRSSLLSQKRVEDEGPTR